MKHPRKLCGDVTTQEADVIVQFSHVKPLATRESCQARDVDRIGCQSNALSKIQYTPPGYTSPGPKV